MTFSKFFIFALLSLFLVGCVTQETAGKKKKIVMTKPKLAKKTTSKPKVTKKTSSKPKVTKKTSSKPKVTKKSSSTKKPTSSGVVMRGVPGWLAGGATIQSEPKAQRFDPNAIPEAERREGGPIHFQMTLGQSASELKKRAKKKKN